VKRGWPKWYESILDYRGRARAGPHKEGYLYGTFRNTILWNEQLLENYFSWVSAIHPTANRREATLTTSLPTRLTSKQLPYKTSIIIYCLVNWLRYTSTRGRVTRQVGMSTGNTDWVNSESKHPQNLNASIEETTSPMCLNTSVSTPDQTFTMRYWYGNIKPKVSINNIVS
jgi:hypothetical protein